MISTFIGIIAIVFYFGGAILQYFSLKKRDKSNRSKVLVLGAIALICHTLSFNGTVYTSQGLDLGFYSISSLIGWIMALLITVSAIRKPLQNLFIGIYPIAAAGLTTTLLVSLSSQADKTVALLTPHSTVHILLSIFAYSVLTIAAAQAALVALQDHQLRRHKTNGLIMQLPPLQLMEQLMFELLWVGVVLLSASIATGIFFIDNIFAQHLAHKSILSIIAWCLFSTLLAGRFALGWRGTTAIRWTVGGYILLMLAFFGSKLVLEVILGTS